MPEQDSSSCDRGHELRIGEEALSDGRPYAGHHQSDRQRWNRVLHSDFAVYRTIDDCRLVRPDIQPRKQLAKCFSKPEPTMQCPSDEAGAGALRSGIYSGRSGDGPWHGRYSPGLQGKLRASTGARVGSTWMFWFGILKRGRIVLPSRGRLRILRKLGTKEIEKRIRVKQVTDGTSHTLLLLEMRQAPTGGPPDSEIDRRAQALDPCIGNISDFHVAVAEFDALRHEAISSMRCAAVVPIMRSDSTSTGCRVFEARQCRITRWLRAVGIRAACVSRYVTHRAGL